MDNIIDTRDKTSFKISLRKLFDITDEEFEAYASRSSVEPCTDSWDENIPDDIRESVKAKVSKNIDKFKYILVYHIGHTLNPGKKIDSLLPLNKLLTQRTELSEYLEVHGFAFLHEGDRITGVLYNDLQLSEEHLSKSRLDLRLSTGEYKDSRISGYLFPIKELGLTSGLKYFYFPEILCLFRDAVSLLGFEDPDRIVEDYKHNRETRIYTTLVPIDNIHIPTDFDARTDFETKAEYIYRKYFANLNDYMSKDEKVAHSSAIVTLKEGVSIPSKDIIDIDVSNPKSS